MAVGESETWRESWWMSWHEKKSKAGGRGRPPHTKPELTKVLQLPDTCSYSTAYSSCGEHDETKHDDAKNDRNDCKAARLRDVRDVYDGRSSVSCRRLWQGNPLRGAPDGSEPDGALHSDGAGSFNVTNSGRGIKSCGLSTPFFGIVIKVSVGANGALTETVLYSFQGGNDGPLPPAL